MVKQAVPLQPTGTMLRRSPHTTMEEPTGQQSMRPEGGRAGGEPSQEHPQAGAAAHGEESVMSLYSSVLPVMVTTG